MQRHRTTRVLRILAAPLAVATVALAPAAASAADGRLTHRETREEVRAIAHDTANCESFYRTGTFVDKTGPGLFDYEVASFSGGCRGSVVPGSFERLGRHAATMRVRFTAVSDRGQTFRFDSDVLVRERGHVTRATVL